MKRQLCFINNPTMLPGDGDSGVSSRNLSHLRTKRSGKCKDVIFNAVRYKIWWWNLRRNDSVIVSINLLQPSDAIWWHKSGSTLAQVMPRCLTAPSYYLDQWLIISEVQWQSQEIPQPSMIKLAWKLLKNYFKISFKSPRGQWVKQVTLHKSDPQLQEITQRNVHLVLGCDKDERLINILCSVKFCIQEKIFWPPVG